MALLRLRSCKRTPLLRFSAIEAESEHPMWHFSIFEAENEHPMWLFSREANIKYYLHSSDSDGCRVVLNIWVASKKCILSRQDARLVRRLALCQCRTRNVSRQQQACIYVCMYVLLCSGLANKNAPSPLSTGGYRVRKYACMYVRRKPRRSSGKPAAAPCLKLRNG